MVIPGVDSRQNTGVKGTSLHTVRLYVDHTVVSRERESSSDLCPVPMYALFTTFITHSAPLHVV